MCACFAMRFILDLFTIKYDQIQNRKDLSFSHFPLFRICVQSGLIIYGLEGMECVCVTHARACVCVCVSENDKVLRSCE